MIFTKTHQLLAQEDIIKGQRIIARQRRLIEEIRARKGDTIGGEGLLAQFERSLAVFEEDLTAISSQG
jgi:hypothetical protein